MPGFLPEWWYTSFTGIHPILEGEGFLVFCIGKFADVLTRSCQTGQRQ